MPKHLTLEWHIGALTRALDALEEDLLEASDEEILQVATDLGMNPAMRGSAAFQGLKFPAQPKIADFFNLDAWNLDAARRVASLNLVDVRAQPTKKQVSPLPTARKETRSK